MYPGKKDLSFPQKRCGKKREFRLAAKGREKGKETTPISSEENITSITSCGRGAGGETNPSFNEGKKKKKRSSLMNSKHAIVYLLRHQGEERGNEGKYT